MWLVTGWRLPSGDAECMNREESKPVYLNLALEQCKKNCKNKLLGCTAVLLSFTSITPALAYPLDSSVFGPDGACDSSSLNLSAGAKKGMERGSEGEYDLFGES